MASFDKSSNPIPGLWKRLSLLALVALVPLAARGQALTASPPATAPNPAPAAQPPAPTPTVTPAPAPQVSQSALDRLTQSNHDLLELLKKQQGVLEDMQYDRRLQSRQIDILDVRLTESLEANAALQAKVAKLQAQLDAPPPAVPPAVAPSATVPPAPPPVPAPPPTPPPPATYLPPAPSEGYPGVKSWHRIYTLSGSDNETSDPIHIDGHSWRVLWHNQDKEGDAYKNTSALFINAFAKGDTIPQKVCSKLGSGGDSTDLVGPGDFELKIEASGGKWELAVEDFR